MEQINNHIILFDGVCNLCNGAVQFVIKHDKKSIFKFAALQSKFGEQFLLKNDFSATNFNSFIYIRHHKILQKSSAALYVLKDMKGFTALGFGFIIVPKFIRDFVYSIIAKNRYKWFGKKNVCLMPTVALNNRFFQ